MENNKQQTTVEWLIEQLSTQFTYEQKIQFERLFEMAKERDKERMIKLIQFIVSEKELVDYSSVSKETANYYLDRFNQEE